MACCMEKIRVMVMILVRGKIGNLAFQVWSLNMAKSISFLNGDQSAGQY